MLSGRGLQAAGARPGCVHGGLCPLCTWPALLPVGASVLAVGVGLRPTGSSDQQALPPTWPGPWPPECRAARAQRAPPAGSRLASAFVFFSRSLKDNLSPKVGVQLLCPREPHISLACGRGPACAAAVHTYTLNSHEHSHTHSCALTHVPAHALTLMFS